VLKVYSGLSETDERESGEWYLKVNAL